MKIQNQTQKSQNGSTIVGVLAALVFIGIVTAMMVKNTGAQSANSAGYASNLLMHSTVESGLLATESFFAKKVNAERGALMIDSMVNFSKPIYVFGSASQRRPFASNAPSEQFFRSKGVGGISKLQGDGCCVLAGFEVAAGRKAGGKDLLKGRTFYRFGNLTQPSSHGSGANNAVLAMDRITNADAGMTVEKGPATFMDSAKFQNAAAIFESNAYFAKKASFMRDSAYFKDTVYFANATELVEFHTKAIFDSMAIFSGPVQFESNAPATFKEKAFFLNDATFKGTVNFLKGAYFKKNPLFQGAATFKQKTYLAAGATFEAQAPAAFDTVYIGGNTVFGTDATFNSITQIDGTVTFNGNVICGAKNSAGTFSTDDHWTYFGGDVVIGKESKFYGETFFAKTLKLAQNNDMDFFHRVGFDGDITLNGRTIFSKKAAVTGSDKFDVFIHGKFADNGKVSGIAGEANHGVYYSEAFGSDPKFISTWKPALVNFAKVMENGDIKTTAFAKMTKIVKDKLKPAPTIPVVPPDSTRRDPQLDINKIYNVSTAKGGNIEIYDAKTAMTSNGSTFDINRLKTKYAEAKAKPSGLYLGKYMVIEISTAIGPPSNDPGIFDADIIYIIKDGGSFDCGSKFYSSSTGPNAGSTLIYVGAGSAKLEQFGTGGDFHGFIYIDKNNTSDNSIKFQDNGKGRIIGAVHSFSPKKLSWNTGKPGYSTPVIFDRALIDSFGPLYPPTPGSGTDSGPGSITVMDPTKGLIVTPLGYYVY
jgi:hypothetical protein